MEWDEFVRPYIRRISQLSSRLSKHLLFDFLYRNIIPKNMIEELNVFYYVETFVILKIFAYSV